ncbi:MAG: DNA-methyltransferase [Deltaproteobacteria bacterium]
MRRTSADAARAFRPAEAARPSGRAHLERADALELLRAQPDGSVDLIVTDPPYSGMNQHLKLGRGRIVGDYGERGVGGKWFQEFHDTPENYHALLGECRRVLRDDRHLFLMFDAFSLLTLGPLVREHFAVKNVLVWDKVAIGMGHYFRRQCELIVFACKGKRPLSRRNFSDVLRIRRLVRARYPTQKPVALFERLIEASQLDGDREFVVCDPFVGSGSAAVAALRRGARFIGADVSKEAIALASSRVKTFEATGEDLLERP